MKLLVSVLIPLMLLFLSSCAPGESEAAPPEIHYGEDICIECNMIISDVRFASGYAHEVAPNRYESLAFDDIGDMLAHAAKHPEHRVVNWYVHDYGGEDWLDGTMAHYVFSNQLHTPMGQGIAAHATLEAAQAMAAELGGEVLSWDDLLAKYAGSGKIFSISVLLALI